MTVYNYQTVTYDGTDITFAAATGGVLGDSVPSTNDRGFIWIKNAAAGGTITVGIVVDGTRFGVANPDISISIPDGEERLIGPLVTDLAFAAIGGGIAMSITPNATGVTGAAIRLP